MQALKLKEKQAFKKLSIAFSKMDLTVLQVIPFPKS